MTMKKKLSFFLCVLMLLSTTLPSISVSATEIGVTVSQDPSDGNGSVNINDPIGSTVIWDGAVSTSLRPRYTKADAAEAGSEENPWLIQSPADWMYLVKTQDSGRQIMYEGEFFEQTCNLDFCNKTIQSIGGV